MQLPDYLVLPAVDAITRCAVAATSTSAQALPAQPGELVLVSTDTDCFAKFGLSGVAEASATVYTVFLPAGSIFVMRVTTTATHVRVIRDTADGFLSFTKLGDF